MPSHEDFLIRLALLTAAAVASFTASWFAFARKAGLSRSELCVFAGLYWPLFLADLAPVIWAGAFRFDPEASLSLTAVIYVLAVALALIAVHKGLKRAVAASAAALVLRWMFNILFGSVYSFFVE